MAEYHIAEMFTSINGEGPRAGQLAVFVRFTGCNLSCSYCDTKWANQKDTKYECMDTRTLVTKIKDTGISNVTLTGGEPLYREGIEELIQKLMEDSCVSVEIETNGSVSLDALQSLKDKYTDRLLFTMDYKLSGSGMESKMDLHNMNLLKANDTVKFVCSSKTDLERALQIMKGYHLIGRCHIYLSPVFGMIDPATMVEFMKENKLNGVNFQLQLHKFIWDPDKRGV